MPLAALVPHMATSNYAAKSHSRMRLHHLRCRPTLDHCPDHELEPRICPVGFRDSTTCATPTSLESGADVASSSVSLAINQEDAGRSTKLLRQSPVKPKVGAGFGSENQNLVNAASLGAQNQWALPSSSTAHQRAPFGAWDQSTFMVQSCHGQEQPANRFGLLQLQPAAHHPVTLETRPASSPSTVSGCPPACPT